VLSRSLSDVEARVALDCLALMLREAGRLDRVELGRVAGPDPEDVRLGDGRLRRPVTGSMTLRLRSP
jgi:hypothetical protein